jgi:hypothetical protein
VNVNTQLVGSATKIKEWCCEKSIKWQFCTPTAAHHNGCSEALVRTCKTALKHAIGEQILSALELQTVLFEVANLVNERPIGRSSSYPDDGGYICPNDILLGRASSTVPQGPFQESRNPRLRVEFCQKIVNSFWTRWYKDVFPSLVPRKKWQVSRQDVCCEIMYYSWRPIPFEDIRNTVALRKCFVVQITKFEMLESKLYQANMNGL